MAAAALLLPFGGAKAAGAKKKTKSFHRVLSCNIRVALPRDEEKGLGWGVRKKVCASIIKKQNPDIICMQEVLKVQGEDMRTFFPDFFSFGFEGPDMDKFSEGYHGIAKNVILFSKARYELVACGCFWLSETPVIAGSMSWGTARARHANWVRLRDRRSAKEFRLINIHLDHISKEAREAQIAFVMKEAAQYQAEFPQLLAGDFNTGVSSEVLSIVEENGWQDTYSATLEKGDPGFTYHGFKGSEYQLKKPSANKDRRIDFIMSRGEVKALDNRIIRDSQNGHFPSDHYFIAADIELL